MKRLLWLPLLALPLVAAAEDGQKPNRGLGLNAGVFSPSSSEMRALFGNTWLNVGIQPLNFSKPRDWRIFGGISFLTANRDGNRVLAIPATVGVLKEFNRDADTVPYVAVAAGPAYYDYALTRGFERFATKRVGWNANLRAGVTFNQRLQVQLRYDFYSSTDDFQFDGLTLNASYLVFRF